MRISVLDGYAVALSICQGLPTMVLVAVMSGTAILDFRCGAFVYFKA